MLLAWQGFLNHRAAPRLAQTDYKQTLSVLALTLTLLEKLSKVGRTLLGRMKTKQILLGMAWKRN